MIRVLIEIEDGQITNVVATEATEVYVLDHDWEESVLDTHEATIDTRPLVLLGDSMCAWAYNAPPTKPHSCEYCKHLKTSVGGFFCIAGYEYKSWLEANTCSVWEKRT